MAVLVKFMAILKTSWVLATVTNIETHSLLRYNPGRSTNRTPFDFNRHRSRSQGASSRCLGQLDWPQAQSYSSHVLPYNQGAGV